MEIEVAICAKDKDNTHERGNKLHVSKAM
uniref:Uncharacterized protein n=1 Tax=Tetraselmis sp. GSL018 TaxID=582737 RepID=A0A061R1T0_9CHLO